MQLVLDSNIYIFTFGSEPKDSCISLFQKIITTPEALTLRTCRAILEEVERNIAPQRFKELWEILSTLAVLVDEDWQIPYQLGVKYERLGLKAGDAFIAAYTEWTGSDYLITENRDFLHLVHLPFKISKADPFLKNC